jgi:putative SOS response-associated peptidase YedK
MFCGHVVMRNTHSVWHNRPMCGRYRLSRRKQLVVEYFDADPRSDAGDDEWSPRYNIAPTQAVAVIRQHPEKAARQLSVLRWGLIPSWATDPSGGFKTINARSETVTSTASFREPFKTQRCLIPADGFYEWQRNGKSKQPYCFEVGEGEIFAFAGLWDRWIDRRIDPRGQAIETCTILTTTPNALLQGIHDRMPVILNPANYDSWLNPSAGDTNPALQMLVPYGGSMRRYPVSARLNLVQNDDPECAKPVELESPQQGQLFC